MKKVLLLFFFPATVFSAPADLFRLGGESFHPATNVQVVWNVAATNLPCSLWIYKVMPQNFSAAVMSNLYQLGDFQNKSNTASAELRNNIDKNYIQIDTRLTKKNIGCLLNMAPALGSILFQDSRNNDQKTPIENVPGTNDVKKLAFEYLGLLGIDRSQISSTPPRGTITTLQRGSEPEKTSECGVFLVRRIDGLDERGFCFYANFGSNSNLLQFELNWRNLMPFELHPVATTNEIADFIRNGRATIPSQGIDLETLHEAKKLTITTFFPLYFNDIGYRHVDFEYPFAVMDIVADVGNSNTISFTLNCPILSTNVVLKP